MRAGVKLIGCMAIFLVAAWVAPAGAAAINVTHSFDTTNQGWSFTDEPPAGSADWEALSGNPPGAISGVDAIADASNPPAFFAAPAAYVGDLSANRGGTIGFDFGSEAKPTAGRLLTVALIDTDPMFPTAIIFQLPPVVEEGFHRYMAPLSEAGWQACAFADDPPCPAATTAEFDAAIADVDRLRLLVDVASGTGETYVVDNVSLLEAAAPIPLATPTLTPATAAVPVATMRKCPKSKKLVVKKGKRKCKRRRKK